MYVEAVEMRVYIHLDALVQRVPLDRCFPPKMSRFSSVRICSGIATAKGVAELSHLCMVNM